jgi:hypothetical protein
MDWKLLVQLWKGDNNTKKRVIVKIPWKEDGTPDFGNEYMVFVSRNRNF